MARIGLAVFLRLVELGLRAAAGRLSRVQLWLRPSSCAIRARACALCACQFFPRFDDRRFTDWRRAGPPFAASSIGRLVST